MRSDISREEVGWLVQYNKRGTGLVGARHANTLLLSATKLVLEASQVLRRQVDVAHRVVKLGLVPVQTVQDKRLTQCPPHR
jgi:hypothetical protein